MFLNDLEISLRSPGASTSQLLMDRVSGSNVSPSGSGANIDILLTDSATTSVSNLNSNTGPFAPSPGSLSAFEGTSAVGTWEVVIADEAQGDSGELLGLDLILTCEEGGAATIFSTTSRVEISFEEPVDSRDLDIIKAEIADMMGLQWPSPNLDIVFSLRATRAMRKLLQRSTYIVTVVHRSQDQALVAAASQVFASAVRDGTMISRLRASSPIPVLAVVSAPEVTQSPQTGDRAPAQTEDSYYYTSPGNYDDDDSPAGDIGAAVGGTFGGIVCCVAAVVLAIMLKKRGSGTASNGRVSAYVASEPSERSQHGWVPSAPPAPPSERSQQDWLPSAPPIPPPSPSRVSSEILLSGVHWTTPRENASETGARTTGERPLRDSVARAEGSGVRICSICLECPDERVMFLPCQHHICTGCSEEFFASTNAPRCPECRQEIRERITTAVR
ncbi:unnamed protein product [Pedinophyceae sp. YPF-701]|nr:unnamed protein product [Pedinophyceae sp. YPF-701]